MKIDKRYKIERATSEDPTRFALGNVHIAEDGAHLVATTGSILARVPVTMEEGDRIDSASLPPVVLTVARQLGRARDEASIKLGEAFGLADGSTRPRPTPDEAGRFPQYSQIIPKDPAIVHSVTINPRALRDLCEAIGADDSVTLEFQDTTGRAAIIVRSGEGYGLIMPRRS